MQTELLVEVYRAGPRAWHWRVVKDTDEVVAESPSPKPTAELAQRSYDAFASRLRAETLKVLVRS